MAGKIPLTVVTGFFSAGKTFFSAGKTTPICHIMEHANGQRIALIINKSGDVGVDGKTLHGCGDGACRDEDIMERSNGCICCTVTDEFIPAMQKLLTRPDTPDHIVIETSELALPQPLVCAFNWPGISTCVTVDGEIIVPDGKVVDDGLFAHSPTAADMIVVNKSDLMDDPDDFETFAVTVGQIDNPQAYAARLSQVIRDNGILRLKGLAAVEGKPMRLAVQVAGPRVDSYFDRPFGPNKARETRLVVIGAPGLDRAAITARLQA